MIGSTRLSKEKDGHGDGWSSEVENVNDTLVLTSAGRGGGKAIEV